MTGGKPQQSNDPLLKPVQYVRGVGPFRATILAGMGVNNVGELIEYFPFRFEEQGRPQAIDTLLLDEEATVIGVVDRVRVQQYGQTIRADISDGTGTLQVTWFNAGFMRDRLQRGQVLRLFGKVGVNQDLAAMVNPRTEWLDPDEDPSKWDYSKSIPIYRGTEKLPSSQIAKLVEVALAEGLPAIREFMPPALSKKHQLTERVTAIKAMHHPHGPEELAGARKRLAYEELFMMQLAIALKRRWAATRACSPPLRGSPLIDERIRKRFPFPLTAAQNRVVREIGADLARDKPMNRLLQGDVGSGKTVVALYAALVTIANKQQCAILAPTEVLAAQHFAGIEKYLAGSKVRRCLLTGKTTAAQRDKILRAIAAGEIDLIVGTQALLEKRVQFARLALVIVDEQHKFGVSQRASLRSKRPVDACKDAAVHGQRAGSQPAHRHGRPAPQVWLPHYLVMTATPIPRTLSMTVFGDLDVSVIDALPPGRQPIRTALITPRDEPAAWRQVQQRIAAGEQVYIVYPLVEESDALDLRAATVEVDRVAHQFLPGSRVALLHGRMKNTEKQAVMREFASGAKDVLVATTVIEVGIDVPNATVMIVQHAERYGLSALHQLRGRVGRGSKASICLLMSEVQGGTARRRLEVLCQTTDGFRIAEEDLKIRGPGELLGTRQHGFPEFRVANLAEDTHLLMQARDDAAALVAADPALAIPEHQPLKSELRRRFREKIAWLDAG